MHEIVLCRLIGYTTHDAATISVTTFFKILLTICAHTISLKKVTQFTHTYTNRTIECSSDQFHFLA